VIIEQHADVEPGDLARGGIEPFVKVVEAVQVTE